MIIKNIPQIGNPIISQKSTKVEKITTKEIKTIVKNLADTIRVSNLIGMAANQIGFTKRIFITEIRATKYRNPKDIDPLKVFINPKIIWKSKRMMTMYESCGSVIHTQLFGPVKRPESIKIEAYDLEGKKFLLNASGLLARVIQHEYDHLDGITFLEKITDLSKVMSADEYMKKNKK